MLSFYFATLSANTCRQHGYLPSHSLSLSSLCVAGEEHPRLTSQLASRWVEGVPKITTEKKAWYSLFIFVPKVLLSQFNPLDRYELRSSALPANYWFRILPLKNKIKTYTTSSWLQIVTEQAREWMQLSPLYLISSHLVSRIGNVKLLYIYEKWWSNTLLITATGMFFSSYCVKEHTNYYYTTHRSANHRKK